MRAFRILVLTTGLLTASHAFAQLSSFNTENLRLLYFDPTETYLVPHVVQSFEGSLATQKRIFNYDPFENVSVLLTDFSDYGNAGASSVPRNSVIVDIAPIPMTF